MFSQLFKIVLFVITTMVIIVIIIRRKQLSFQNKWLNNHGTSLPMKPTYHTKKQKLIESHNVDALKHIRLNEKGTTLKKFLSMIPFI